MASSMAPTFLAALRAVGTASTMAFTGFYLHRRNFVTPSGKKMMALLSQQVTIPAFLFAKIIYCPSGGSTGSDSSGGGGEVDEFVDPSEPEIVCPSVANRISDLWLLLLWPGYVVLCGLLTGYVAARVSKTPPLQVNSCLAACAFGNSTGLPITLLAVIHKQFKKTSELGRIDPTAFLSIYLLFYPVLQWGVGGWLLAPEEKPEQQQDGGANSNAKSMEKEISMVEKKEISMENGTGIHEASPLIQTTTTNNGPEHTNATHRHTRSMSYHISHLLNHEKMHQSPSFIAGQEEFGGVRTRRFLLRSSDNSIDGQQQDIGAQQHQHRRWYTAGEIDSSNPALSMMVRELSFTSTGAPSRFSSFERIPAQIQASPRMSRNNAPSYGSGAYLLPGPDMQGDDEDGPLTIDAAPSIEGSDETAWNAMIADTTITDTPTIHEDVAVTSNNGHAAAAPSPTMNSKIDEIPRSPSPQQIESMQQEDVLPLSETLLRISRKIFQPPVIGALMGLFIASFPMLRGLLENIYGDAVPTAPFKWMFDGIYSVGQAAVPINMAILGINLSSTFQKKKKSISTADTNKMLSNRTMMAVVFGKMFVMPIIGIVSTWLLQQYFVDFPDEVDATCYLVMMIVFITPTANNVMVMVELSGSSSKEGMARLIGWQYAVSPVVLSVILAIVVNLASNHFDDK